MSEGFLRRLGICLLSITVVLCAFGLQNALSQSSKELADLASELRAKDQELANLRGDLDKNRHEIRSLKAALEEQSVQLSSWIENLTKRLSDSQDKRDAASSARVQEALGLIDKRLEMQERRMTETMKTVGTKLSAQNEQQSGQLAKLEEATKQGDLQLRSLAPRVDQLKISLAELSKAMHVLTEKSTATDQRVMELSGQTENKLGTLGVHVAEQAAQTDRLAKRLESEAQAMTAHVNTVTQNVNGMAKSLETVQSRMAQLGSQSAQNETQDARIEALTKTLNATVSTLNESSRSLADLKQLLEMSVSKLATRIDEQGEALNRVLQRGAADRPAPNGHGETASADRKSSPAKAAQEIGLRPETAYDHAYQEYLKNQPDSALVYFQNFLSQFPDSDLVPNAHYWIGECYIQKREYARGIDAYEQVIRNYPHSGKAPSALYRKAVVLLGLNDKTAAKSALHRVINDYPKSEESKKARAKLATLQ